MQAYISLEKLLKYLTKIFLFLLPVQTIWIYRTVVLDGAKWQWGTLGFYLTEALLWLIIFGFIWWYLRKKKLFESNTVFRWTRDRIFLLACLFFVVYNFFSILWAPDPSLAMQSSLWILEAILLFLILSSGPFQLEKLCWWFVLGGLLQAVIAVLQFVSQTSISSVLLGISTHPIIKSGVSVVEGGEIGRWLRSYGFFPHPNILGGYLSFVLIVLLSIFTVSDVQMSKKKLKLSLSLIILTAGIFVTFSRSAWLVSVGVLLFTPLYGAIEKKDNSKLITDTVLTALSTLLVLGAVTFPLVTTRLSFDSTTEIRSVNQRLTGYQTALDVFKENPLLGVGVGNYTAHLIERAPGQPGWFYQPVHNTFMLISAELGFVGTLLLAVLITAYCYFLFYKRRLEPEKSYFLTSILFALLVFSLVDHYLVSSYIGLMMMSVVVGLFSRKQINSLDTV